MLCTCERDGGGCVDGGDKMLYLVIYADETCEIYCGDCIEANPKQFPIGTKFYFIGDDVTHHFL